MRVEHNHLDQGAVNGCLMQDEREALEALFCLSGANVQPVNVAKKLQHDYDKSAAAAASKQAQQWQPQEQNSKGSSETAGLLYGSCKAAVAVERSDPKQHQLIRQYSPSSDVSSGAYHTALMMQDPPCSHQQLDEEQQHLMQLTDIHPAALLPNDVVLRQQVPTAALPPRTTSPEQHQQRTRQIQPELSKPAAHQQGNQQSSCLYGTQKASVAALQEGVRAAEPIYQTLLHPAAATAGPSVSGQGSKQALDPAALAAVIQASSSPALLPLILQQLLAHVQAPGSGAPSMSHLLAQLLPPVSAPGAVSQLLMQLLQQQHQPATRANNPAAPRLPMPGGRMHVHIAHMIAQGRREQQQADETAQGVGNIQQQQALPGAGLSMQVARQTAGGSDSGALNGPSSKVEHKRKAPTTSAAEPGTNAKRHKQQQQQVVSAVAQHPPQDALLAGHHSAQMPAAATAAHDASGLLGGLAGLLPHMAPVFGAGFPPISMAAAAPAAHQAFPPTSSAAQLLSQVQQAPTAALATGLQQQALLAQLMGHAAAAPSQGVGAGGCQDMFSSLAGLAAAASGAAGGIPVTLGAQRQTHMPLQTIW